MLRQYVAYDHNDRTHLALAKETPAGRRPWRHAKRTLPSWPYHDLADCIIATTLRRESSHRLSTELVQFRKRDERIIDDRRHRSGDDAKRRRRSLVAPFGRCRELNSHALLCDTLRRLDGAVS